VRLLQSCAQYHVCSIVGQGCPSPLPDGIMYWTKRSEGQLHASAVFGFKCTALSPTCPL
jgi:hypothetical protein